MVTEEKLKRAFENIKLDMKKIQEQNKFLYNMLERALTTNQKLKKIDGKTIGILLQEYKQNNKLL